MSRETKRIAFNLKLPNWAWMGGLEVKGQLIRRKKKCMRGFQAIGKWDGILTNCNPVWFTSVTWEGPAPLGAADQAQELGTGATQAQPWRWFRSRSCSGSTKEQTVFTENSRCLRGCLELAVPRRKRSRSGLCLLFLGFTRCDEHRLGQQPSPGLQKMLEHPKPCSELKASPGEAAPRCPERLHPPRGEPQSRRPRRLMQRGEVHGHQLLHGPALEQEKKECATPGADWGSPPVAEVIPWTGGLVPS